MDVRGGNFAPIQTFLIISTCFLYLVAAGLFSKAVWMFQENHVCIPLIARTIWNLIFGSGLSSLEKILRRLDLGLDHTTFAKVYGM